MDFLRLLLIFLHFIGLAALLGGFLAQLPASEKQITNGMLHGALTQLVTGAALLQNQQAKDQRARQAVLETALRNHVDGDMMHDAIRSDVLSAILAAGKSDAAAGRKDEPPLPCARRRPEP